jgi:glycosyltransferase involved in cell wall biosynthesis
MTFVTNFKSFPATWKAGNGDIGNTIYAVDTQGFLAHRNEPDTLFLVNGNPRLVLALSAAMLWGARRPLISADIVLRVPEKLSEKLQHPIKRMLLGRVDHFIHYFRDLHGMENVYGIGPSRSSFVPFKVNLVSRHALQPQFDGEYALCFGRSMRDFDTFLAAMEKVPYPGAITRPNFEMLAAHHGRFTRALKEIPSNVRILEDDGTEQSEIRILQNARLLVLPILKKSLVASGISTCLNAMFLGKCVIGSEGPGMSDVFGSEVLTFPPENPEALATVVRRAWEDEALSRATAEAGRQYALNVGAEEELYQRLIDDVAQWCRQHR